MKSIKNKIFKIIQPADNSSILSKMFDLVIVTLILINTVTIIAATFSLSALKIRIFLIIEIVSVIIFSVEYILRLWTADLLYPEKKPFIARIKFFFSPMAIVDLLAILPFYIPFLLPIDLRILRLIRLLRLFRLFKMNRYTSGLSSIGNVLKKKSDQLVSSIFVVFLLMIISSVIMYYFENPVQPDVFFKCFFGFMVGNIYVYHCGIWGYLSSYRSRKNIQCNNCFIGNRACGCSYRNYIGRVYGKYRGQQ